MPGCLQPGRVRGAAGQGLSLASARADARPKGQALAASAMAAPSSRVVALPPMSGVRAAGSGMTFSMACSMALAASPCPRWSSMRAPDQIWPMGLAIPLPAMSGAGAVNGLEHGGVLPRRIDVGRWRNPNGPCDGRAQVRQNIAEEVAAHHHIEPIRVLDEVRGQDIDMVLVRANIGILGRNGRKRSSQKVMVWMMPLDLVAEVRCFAGRLRARSKA